MKVFVDANIILDRYDTKRPYHTYSIKAIEYIIQNAKIYTSCDIITTIYYIDSKRDKQKALSNIQNINKVVNVIEFSNKEIEQTCQLMSQDSDYKDLEDTIQYILAKKLNCDLIISNDKNFTSKDIPVISSKEFCEKKVSSET